MRMRSIYSKRGLISLSQSYNYVKEHLSWVNHMEEIADHPIIEQPSIPKPSPFPEKSEMKEPSTISPTIIDKFAPKMGYSKQKVDIINPQTKKAIVVYLSTIITDIIIFLKSGVDDITAPHWVFTPFAWMTLMVALVSSLPVLFMAWRENAKENISVNTQ